MRKVKILLAVFIILILVAFTPVLQTQKFQNIVTKKLTVTNDTTLQSGLTVDSGGVTVTGGLTTLSGGLNITPQTAVVTTAFVITPVSSIISLSSIGAATSSTATGIITTTATNGDIIILSNNNAADALTIDGTGGTVECKANVVLGAADTLTLWYNGADLVWNCLAGYDNS